MLGVEAFTVVKFEFVMETVIGSVVLISARLIVILAPLTVQPSIVALFVSEPKES